MHSPAPAPDPWDAACRGEFREAYRGLTDRVERGFAQEEVFLQLYWLLVHVPELEPDRPASDWLVRGLRHCGQPAWRIRELLGREAAADPAMAIGERIAGLLAPGIAPELVLEVTAWRWRAARRLERWEVITADLQTLRSWMPEADDQTWAQLVISAATNLTWDARGKYGPLGTLDRELEAVSHLGFDLSHDLDQLEYVQSIVSGLERLLAWGELHRLVRLSCDPEGPELRARLRAHLARVAREPSAALQFLDQLRDHAPALLGRLGELSSAFQEDWVPEHPPPARDDVTSAAEQFLGANRWWDYKALRPHLLDFCMRELISPDLFGRSVAGRPEYVLSDGLHLSHAIAADWSLRYVYRAYDLAWR
jgi:hypothetical protein